MRPLPLRPDHPVSSGGLLCQRACAGVGARRPWLWVRSGGFAEWERLPCPPSRACVTITPQGGTSR